jgi:hypothetical protein
MTVWKSEGRRGNQTVMRAMEGPEHVSQCVLCAMADLGSLMSDCSDGQFWKCSAPDTLHGLGQEQAFGNVYKPQLIILFTTR